MKVLLNKNEATEVAILNKVVEIHTENITSGENNIFVLNDVMKAVQTPDQGVELEISDELIVKFLKLAQFAVPKIVKLVEVVKAAAFLFKGFESEMENLFESSGLKNMVLDVDYHIFEKTEKGNKDKLKISLSEKVIFIEMSAFTNVVYADGTKGHEQLSKMAQKILDDMQSYSGSKESEAYKFAREAYTILNGATVNVSGKEFLKK